MFSRNSASFFVLASFVGLTMTWMTNYLCRHLFQSDSFHKCFLKPCRNRYRDNNVLIPQHFFLSYRSKVSMITRISYTQFCNWDLKLTRKLLEMGFSVNCNKLHRFQGKLITWESFLVKSQINLQPQAEPPDLMPSCCLIMIVCV